MYIERADIDHTALQGCVAVVTGAGQGIGRETARQLATLGASVAIAELSEIGRDTERMIQAEGNRALFVQTDVADPASIEALREHCQSAFGDVDILINNAEAFTCKPLLDLTVAEWDRIFAVNLRGAFLGIQAFLPAMLQRGKGIIITMESAEGMPYLAPYLASKVGLRSLAASLAQEVRAQSGVWVYCFGPGMVETPGGMRAFRELAPRYGMTFDEFIRQAAPGGSLISAELCATGLIGTLLHAQQFHGQETDYVAGLSLLGLSPDGQRSGSQPPQIIEQTYVTPDRLCEALVLNQRLEAILRTNAQEYDEQNMFVRPVVRRMFQQGTGLNVEDWRARAQEMTRRLRDASKVEEVMGQPAQTLDVSQLAAYRALVQRMADYITKQESDARGWMRDPARLKAALDALRERKATVQRLAEVLGQMQGGTGASILIGVAERA